MKIFYGVAVHGGAGSPPELSGGCKTACESAFSLLEEGNSALDAVVKAACILEDDGRFNAGSGSALRLDGRTIEMDGGADIVDACRSGVCLFPEEIASGVIGISRNGYAVESNREMAHYAMLKER